MASDGIRSESRAIAGFQWWVRERLAQLRPAQQQKDLARHLGMSASNLTKVLKGHVNLTAADIRRIAEFLKTPVEDVANAAFGFLADQMPAGRAILGENVAGVVAADTEPHSGLEGVPILYGLGAARSFDELAEQGEVHDTRRPHDDLVDEVGPNGLGFLVRGESMAGFVGCPIHSGDIVWTAAQRPDARRRAHGLVVAIVQEEEGGEPRYVIKEYDGERLYSHRAGEGRSEFAVAAILDVTRVVGVEPPVRRPPR
jgi:transcriptional regulator with XRE-family HTH domain